jgi:hypothetical protein
VKSIEIRLNPGVFGGIIGGISTPAKHDTPRQTGDPMKLMVAALYGDPVLAGGWCLDIFYNTSWIFFPPNKYLNVLSGVL